ncbi:GNAT family N-acetyltransferase [Sutcliffiella rhizosphaerae]|uniref:N-acetyltransferase domain-containing protein n=1 Tax=Sutcliffiella rhizosphaerae TaxID=2880967 RepID=A0ABN8A520_9BACI|nr:GNAT family N-acetyltransferase [Sutcliffiella rhizosphaerae]CAG9620175.1 hypothetical protein BACCIP111883_00943 [Sutcliffiella rhizosphaerae]
MAQVNLIELSTTSLEKEGCYCLRSKPKSEGYRKKSEWLKSQFQHGLKYVNLKENGKAAGFIEYAPIEASSRVVYGENYLVIHCLWVHVTGKGYASKLIQTCLQDAKELGKAGVIVVTNPSTSWTPSKDIFIKNDFKEIAKAPYDFELLVCKFGDAADPYFPNNWEERLHHYEELTILRTKQCPYIEVATEVVFAAAAKLEMEPRVVDIQKREELLAISPTPYGVYGVVYKKQLVAFHRLTMKAVMKKIKEIDNEA